MKNKTLKYIILLFGFLFLGNNAYSVDFVDKIRYEVDSVLFKIYHKQAEKKFNALAYSMAIPKYEWLVNKGFMPDSLQRNLAISYFKVHNTLKSEEYFKRLIASAQVENMDYYYYAQSLKFNKKYQDADKYIEKYRELQSDDSRGDLQNNATPVIKEIYSKEKYKIEPVYFNSAYSDFGAVVIDNQVVFTSGRNDQAIVQYEYAWKGQPFLDLFRIDEEKSVIQSDAKLLTKGINSRYHDGPVCYTPDGQEVFVTRNKFQYFLPKYSEQKENHFMLYHAKRGQKDWDELKLLPFNSSEYSCGHPSISANNQTLYFASDMPGGYGGSDIYYVTRMDSGWSDPVNMGSDINTEGDEMFPYISAEDVLYFASNGHLGLGGLDVFMVKENKNGSRIIYNMGYPLNSNADDFSFYLKDEQNGYFASNRKGGLGDDDIYMFEYLEKPTFTLKLIALVKDKRNGNILKNASVNLKDSDGKLIFEGKTNSQGMINTVVNSGENYSMSGSKDKYLDNSRSFIAESENGKDIKVELLLDIVEEWGVFGLIFEKESGKGVQDVQVYITNAVTGKEITEVTDNSGNFRKLLEPDTDYDILLRKKKFFTRRGKFSTKGMEPGWINVKEFIEVEMEEIVLGKTIEIPNIYYDLAKWDIRDDAAVELDKVVQFLLDNETITIELGSHTDARGSNTSNQTLSQKRAESAVNYIVSKGIDTKRITAKGYGESKLKNRCADGIRCSEDEHQENRRTEIMIVDF